MNQQQKFEVPSNKELITINNFRIIPTLIKSKNYYNSCAIHNELVVQKSNLNSDEYNILIGSLININKLYIPSSIKHISDDCFRCNFHLQSVIPPDNSQLLTIGKNAFESTRIR